MSKVNTISGAANYTAVEVGRMSELGQHKLVLGPDVEIPGKVFIGAALKATGAEISFQSFAPGAETGFLHTHKTHEELYIFVSGSGEFQVDGEVFKIKEGSVVRVAPNGRRSVRNTGTAPLVMICVQHRASTFTAEDAADGVILNDRVVW